MPLVKPEIMIWARETAGLTLAEAAHKIRIAEERLTKIEQGKETISHALLRKISKHYMRPEAAFYLNYIPGKSNYGADFRGRSKQGTPRENGLIAALLRYAKVSQGLIRATLELEDEGIPLTFVGSLRRKWDLPKDAELMNEKFQLMPSNHRKSLVSDTLDGLDFALGDSSIHDKYYKQGGTKEAFQFLRSTCERSGIFVIQKNDLGSHHSKISPDLFRAFVISDDIAPLIIINNDDNESAKSFSILHELVHLLLDQTGISDLDSEKPVERFCNEVAGKWLLPSALIPTERIREQIGTTELKETISHISQEYNLSHTMVATRLHQENLISKARCLYLKNYYRQKWEESDSKQKGGPDYYTKMRNRLGNGVLGFVERMLQSEDLSVSKAAIILSVKPGHVYDLLYPPQKTKEQ